MKIELYELVDLLERRIRAEYDREAGFQQQRQSWAKQNAETLGSIARQLQELYTSIATLNSDHLRLLDRIQRVEDTRPETGNGDPGEGTQESDNRPVDGTER